MSFAYLNIKGEINNELNNFNHQLINFNHILDNKPDCACENNHTIPIRNIFSTNNETNQKLRNFPEYLNNRTISARNIIIAISLKNLALPY